MLAGSKWFSTLNLLRGYCQVDVVEKDRHKTAFCTTKGLLELKVMPFSLCNAIATFQQLCPWWSAVVALSCLPGQCQYFGSSLCWSPTEPAGSVSMGLRLWNEAEVLKVWFPLAESAIPWPWNFRGRCCCRHNQDRESDNLAHTLVHLRVQWFLRVASYHWCFIRDFAQIAKPLHSLTEHAIESSTGSLTVN